MAKNIYYNKASNDFIEGLKKWRIWVRLAWSSISEQYQRSLIGPLWITLNTAVIVLTFGLLYGHLLHEPPEQHLAYVAAGFIVWILYSEIITKGCHTFISNGRMIQQLPLPYSVYLYLLTTKELINFVHNILIIAIIFIVFMRPMPATALLSAAALILVVINAMAIALIFGIVSIRFRDFPPIIQALMRPMMFLTPIIWNADAFPERAFFITLNPFFHIVDIVRAPILGQQASSTSWLIVSISTILLCGIAFILFSRYRHRIAYWV